MQLHVRRTWNVDPPGHKAILKWDRTLRETAFLPPQTGKHEKVSVNEETMELQIPRSTIHKIVHKRLLLCAFKIQLRHYIKPNDRPLRAHFAAEMLLRIENDYSYLDNIVFSDEATFHFCGKIHKHNCQIWVQRIPMLFINMRETRLNWMSGVDWRGTQSLDHSSS